MLKTFIALAFSVVGLGGATLARADELVKFNSTAFPGQVTSPSDTPIQGYLSRPKGNGPFPAVVLLHSCLGLPSNRQAIETALVGWGYVALFVDDFTTRGLKDTCSVDFPAGLNDALGGLAYLAGLPDVDKARIGAIGYSQGAYSALQLASSRLNPPRSNATDLRFKAVAAYYPACADPPGFRLRLPTLILVGAADTVTPAAACEALAKAQSGADLKLIVFPGANHVFDDPQFAGGKTLLGMHMEFDPAAAVAAQAALHDFLAAKL